MNNVRKQRRIVAALSATVLGLATLITFAPTASAAIPGAPTGVSATAGNAQVTVSWAPVSATPTPVYYVSAFIGAISVPGCNGTSATTCVLTGLTNGSSYSFYVQAQNLTNHNNYAGYSGVMTSPFFGQPTLVLNPRKVDLGMQFQF